MLLSRIEVAIDQVNAVVNLDLSRVPLNELLLLGTAALLVGAVSFLRLASIVEVNSLNLRSSYLIQVLYMEARRHLLRIPLLGVEHTLFHPLLLPRNAFSGYLVAGKFQAHAIDGLFKQLVELVASMFVQTEAVSSEDCGRVLGLRLSHDQHLIVFIQKLLLVRRNVFNKLSHV